jgi:hypothetical protein
MWFRQMSATLTVFYASFFLYCDCGDPQRCWEDNCRYRDHGGVAGAWDAGAGV